ncbi:MAG: CDP-alcohol phosphatidyltransferase family protein [Spirochaetales bacterium]|jgi:phosphatidylglycerophosphate synthase|nr:CDP-alcohol phosphatidyltransferase family protein [Spirochaetales bacterium]
MKYTLAEIRAALPPEKRRSDGLWGRFVLRPLSFYFTWLALKLRMGADAVSALSALVSLASAVLFSCPGFVLPLLGAAGFNLFSILDCVDGNVARITKTAGPWGGWVDAVTGYAAYTEVFTALSLYCYLRRPWWPVLVIGGLTGGANLLARLAYQNYRSFHPSRSLPPTPSPSAGKVFSLSREQYLADLVGISGLLMPALLAAHLLGRGMFLIVGFNFLFYGGGCLFTLGKLVRTCYRERKEETKNGES